MLAPAETAGQAPQRTDLAEESPPPLNPRFELRSLFERWSTLPCNHQVQPGSWEVVMQFPWAGGKSTTARFDIKTQTLHLKWDHYRDKAEFKGDFVVAEITAPDPYCSNRNHHCLVFVERNNDEIVVFESDGNIRKINTKYNDELPSWLESHFLFARLTKGKKKFGEVILIEG